MDSMLKKIPVVFSFARSGGTLLNQILGMHPEVLILSEVNPSRDAEPMTRQAADWLKLLAEKEKEEFQRLAYGMQIDLLWHKAQKMGKKLILRDWSTVNFMDTKWPMGFMPSQVLEQRLYLEEAGFSVQGLVMVRKFSAMERSIRKTFPDLANIPSEILAKAYLEFAKSVQSYPRIALEVLQMHPLKETKKACKIFGLKEEPAEKICKNFFRFRKCTGNTTLANASISNSWQNIVVQQTEACNKNQPLAATEADQIFGYV